MVGKFESFVAVFGKSHHWTLPGTIRGSCGGWPLGELLHRGPWKMGFLRDMQGALWVGLPLIGALLGNLEGVSLPGLLKEKNWTRRSLRC
jgi:hypothetical protein